MTTPTKTKKTFYYHQLTDDVVQTKNQNFSLPENYQIIKTGPKCKTIRYLATGFAYLFTYLIKHVRVIGRDKIKNYKNQAYFVYANHTQPVNDAFMPLTLFGSQDYYALANQANWSLPFIGKYLLPYGGLPVGKNLKQSIKLIQAIQTLVKHNKHIVIYPEAHVWPYYTQIRPFDQTSMNFPVSLKAPVFVMTTTYQKSKFFKRPRMIVYLDGPFLADSQLTKKDQQKKLHDQILKTMQTRAKLSNYSYYEYKQK
ncbi:1-acyl-sn-glycerol-3-phosphate acyltransferase [uncultured Lactobacillus sp.]|uniref:lysophospholipid acyltransferase family protein n=1 Tax=uncultured Lactobacillus sp. TaxID=153152 RepID=UPI00261EEC22|nr:1-acyl-sn-glycerol-3-phosphate acyltransferase [uncultured Lactobacillus sp.]